MIPQYLREIATKRKVRDGRTTFAITCGCGCGLFDIFVNSHTAEEKKALADYEKANEKIFRRSWAIKGTVDENGVHHTWRYLAPGIRVEVFPPEVPVFASLVCWKLRCSGCGKEHLIFDNRFHGYDGAFCSEDADRDYQPRFRQRVFRDGLPRRIEITTENDRTIEEFRENTGMDCNFDTWSNAFGWIGVDALDSRGKRTRILESETA